MSIANQKYSKENIYLSAYHSSSVELLLNNNYSNPSLLYILSLINKNYLLNDRFNILNNDAEWYINSVNDDINEIKKYNIQSFDDCCYIRAKQIIDYANKKNLGICICASGGVDSTCAISSILQVADSTSNIKILYNKRTLSEYNNLIYILKKNNITCIDTEMNYNKLVSYSKNNILVTGFNGDQILCLFYRKYKDKNWKDEFGYHVISELNNKSIKDFKSYDYWIYQIEKYAKYLNLKIYNWSDVKVILDYGTTTSVLIDKFSSTIDNPNNHIAFYDWIGFYKYFLIHYQKHLYIDSSIYPNLLYKSDMKKVIFKYFKDESYLYMNKTMSYLHYYNMPLGFWWIDNNGRHSITGSIDYISNYVYKNIIKNLVKKDYIDNFYLNYRRYEKWKLHQNGLYDPD